MSTTPLDGATFGPDTTVASDEDLTQTSEGFQATAEVSLLQDYFDQFDALVDEMRLHITEDGLWASAVDPANVAIIVEDLDESAFDRYMASGGMIGFNLGRVIDILSMGDKGELATLELDLETRKLHIQIEELSYTLALIDPESIRKEPDIPQMDLPVTAVVEASDFDRGLTAADMVDNHLTLRTGTTDDGVDALYLEAEGDTDDVDLELTVDEDLVAFEDDGEGGNSLFSLDYLKDINKVIPGDVEITIELGSEFPVKLHYDHNEVDGDAKSGVTVMLAPRISKE
jgi:proliferating cell nuclear antigen